MFAMISFATFAASREKSVAVFSLWWCTTISVNDLSKSFAAIPHRHVVLSGITFRTAAGECLGIVGPNGSGKSTLLLCLAGLVRPSSGSILIDGIGADDVHSKNRIAFVPERHHFLGRFSPETLLDYLGTLSGLTGERLAERIRDVLSDFELLDVRRKRISRFSAGMLQRVNLAQAFLTNPAHLLLDEPTTGLDPRGIIALRRELMKRKAAGTSIIMSSHNLTELARICDRIILIERGRIVRDEAANASEMERLFLRDDELHDHP